VATWFAARGFGFLKVAGRERDLFCHVKDLRGKPAELQRGQKVRFQIGEGSRGPHAISVELLEPVLTTSSPRPRWFRDEEDRGDDAEHAALAETTFMQK